MIFAIMPNSHGLFEVRHDSLTWGVFQTREQARTYIEHILAVCE